MERHRLAARRRAPVVVEHRRIEARQERVPVRPPSLLVSIASALAAAAVMALSDLTRSKSMVKYAVESIHCDAGTSGVPRSASL
jgi:hypothetical protein